MDEYIPGFAKNVDSPEVKAALKKTGRVTAIFMIFLIIAPIAGFAIYSLVTGKMEIAQALTVGGMVSLIFLIIYIITSLNKKLKKPFTGTVIQKKTTIKMVDSDHDGSYTSRKKRVIKIECEDGRKRKKEVPVNVYNYVEEGDKIRWLPQFPQPLEKMRKPGETQVMCMFCGRLNDETGDKCSFCKNPLVK